MTQNQARGKSLTFEVAGEGNLPRVTVAKPTLRNKRGQPLLLFKKILLGTTQSLPLELLNDGTLPSKVTDPFQQSFLLEVVHREMLQQWPRAYGKSKGGV